MNFIVFALSVGLAYYAFTSLKRTYRSNIVPIIAAIGVFILTPIVADQVMGLLS